MMPDYEAKGLFLDIIWRANMKTHQARRSKNRFVCLGASFAPKDRLLQEKKLDLFFDEVLRAKNIFFVKLDTEKWTIAKN